MFLEAEVSNAEWTTKNQLRPSRQSIPSLKLALLCQADFKRGAKLVCSVNYCMLKSKMKIHFMPSLRTQTLFDADITYWHFDTDIISPFSFFGGIVFCFIEAFGCLLIVQTA